MTMIKDKDFYLYRRDNKSKEGGGYSFIIQEAFDIRQVKLICMKRDGNNRRTDMALFYFDYREWMSLIVTVKDFFRNNIELNEKFFGGTGGKRTFTLSLKNKVLTMYFYDETVQTKKGCKEYTGQLMFSIGNSKSAFKNAFDLNELFNTASILNNWEIVNINRLINDSKKTVSEE